MAIQRTNLLSDVFNTGHWTTTGGTITVNPGTTTSGKVEFWNDDSSSSANFKDYITVDELKKLYDETWDAYTKEDQIAMARLVRKVERQYDERIQQLTDRIQTLEEQNTEVLDMLRDLCDRKKRAENYQYGVRS